MSEVAPVIDSVATFLISWAAGFISFAPFIPCRARVLYGAYNYRDRIMCGHARTSVAEKIGMTEVPAICLDHLSPAQLKNFMLADNRLTELATWDDRLLGEAPQELRYLTSISTSKPAGSHHRGDQSAHRSHSRSTLPG